MTDDFIAHGILGGAYAITPSRIAQLFEQRDISEIYEPLELGCLNGRKEKWPRALDYFHHHIELYRQWAYRHAAHNKGLEQEIDNYIGALYEWLKHGEEKGQLNDIELGRLKALYKALTDKLREYVPERLIDEGQAGIKQLLDDIENSEHVERYPPGPSDTWYDSEIKRLSLLSEKIELLMRLVERIHPENADKHHYLDCLGKITDDIADYTGVLRRSRDELYTSIGKGKIDIEEHLSKIDGSIDDTRGDIDRHFSKLHERLAASEPLKIREIVRAFRQYEQSKDTSVLPPIRQLCNALRKLKEPSPEDTSLLVDFIIALGRAIRAEADYHHGILHDFSIAEVLKEIESLDTGTFAGNNPDKDVGSGSNIQGMPWQEAKDEGEKYVKVHGFPGVEPLAKQIKCSKGTMYRAIEASPYLQKAKSQPKRKKTSPPTTELTKDVTEEHIPSPDEEADVRLLCIEKTRNELIDGIVKYTHIIDIAECRADPSHKPQQEEKLRLDLKECTQEQLAQLYSTRQASADDIHADDPTKPPHRKQA